MMSLNLPEMGRLISSLKASTPNLGDRQSIKYVKSMVKQISYLLKLLLMNILFQF